MTVLCGDVQGAAALAVAGVGVGPRSQQQSSDLRVPDLGGFM